MDSATVELTDAQQATAWLSKNVQEIENQLNVLNIFGSKLAVQQVENIQELHTDLIYQQKLLSLEKIRVKYLQDLQHASRSILQLRKENLIV